MNEERKKVIEAAIEEVWWKMEDMQMGMELSREEWLEVISEVLTRLARNDGGMQK